MKNKILVVCAALALVGCAENRGLRNDSGSTGTGSEVRSGSDTNSLPTTNNVQGSGSYQNQNAPSQNPNNNTLQGNQGNQGNGTQPTPSSPSSGDTQNKGNQL